MTADHTDNAAIQVPQIRQVGAHPTQLKTDYEPAAVAQNLLQNMSSLVSL
jgi:hypothetical protein